VAAGPSLDDRDPRGSRRGGSTAKKTVRATPRRGGGRGDRPPWKVWLVRAAQAGALAMFAGIAVVVGLFAYYGSDPKMPNVSRLDEYHPKQVTRILDRNNVPIGELGSEKRTVVPYSAMPKMLIQAVVAAEDADYFKHGGVDYMGMARAFITNVLRGRTAQGGSTITQQVIKNLLLSPERTLKRKVQEIILAHRLSEKLSKEDVLALYLNQIYYGHGRYGCEEAARYFFGKSVREVDLAEAALLAGLPQSPERLSPRKHPEAAKARQRYVLGQMAEHGYIDRKTAERLAAQPIRLARETAAARGVAAEEVDVVARFLRQDGRIGGVRGRHHRRDDAGRAHAGAGAHVAGAGPGGSGRAPGLPRPVRARDRQDGRHPAARAGQDVREVPEGERDRRGDRPPF